MSDRYRNPIVVRFPDQWGIVKFTIVRWYSDMMVVEQGRMVPNHNAVVVQMNRLLEAANIDTYVTVYIAASEEEATAWLERGY